MFASDYGELLRQRLSPEASGRCNFLGWLRWPELIARVAEARVLVAPSVCEEGFGLPPLEAMAVGTVPIVSALGGLPEVVEDGVSGVVMDTTDTSRLAEAIGALMDDDDRWQRMSEAAKARAGAEFSWAQAANDLVELATQLQRRARRQ